MFTRPRAFEAADTVMRGFNLEAFGGEVLREDLAQFHIVIDEEKALHKPLRLVSSYSFTALMPRQLTKLNRGLTVLNRSRSSLMLK
jgi:hypothetical protein